jgi:hypothetical protein
MRNAAAPRCSPLTRPHNWNAMFKCPPQGALRAPCKVRLAPHRLKRALRAQERGVPIGARVRLKTEESG